VQECDVIVWERIRVKAERRIGNAKRYRRMLTVLTWVLLANQALSVHLDAGRHALRPGSAERPQAIYKPSGVVLSVSVQLGTDQRYFLVDELVNPKKWDKKRRLLQLDAQTGRVRELTTWPVRGNVFAERDAYAHNGRLAVDEMRGSKTLESRIKVLETNGKWRMVNEWQDYIMHTAIGWSADSKSLLYVTVRVSEKDGYTPVQTDALIATSVSSDDPFVTKKVVSNLSRYDTVFWSNDSRKICCWRRDAGEWKVTAIDWRSGRETPLFRVAPQLSAVAIAEKTGDLVWIAPSRVSDKGTNAVWRFTPGATAPAELPVAMPVEPIAEAVLSPDGQRLAVAPEKGGLVIYELRNGSRKSVPGYSGKPVCHIQWALEGRDLLFANAIGGGPSFARFGKNVLRMSVSAAEPKGDRRRLQEGRAPGD